MATDIVSSLVSSLPLPLWLLPSLEFSTNIRTLLHPYSFPNQNKKPKIQVVRPLLSSSTPLLLISPFLSFSLYPFPFLPLYRYLKIQDSVIVSGGYTAHHRSVSL